MMTGIDVKIALRTFLKGKWYNFLNVTGLALGLAAFIAVTLYVDNETSYDTWNKNNNRIFLVEREMPNGPSAYTPGKLAAEIKAHCPEIEETGRMNTASYQLPFHTANGRFMIRRWVGADYSIAKILGIQPKGFKLDTANPTTTVLLSRQTAAALFPHDSAVQNKTVNMMAKNGMPMIIAGVAEDAPGNTLLNFDCIGFNEDITQGKDQSYTNQIYQTFILVKPGTNIQQLSAKINKVYKQAVQADTSLVAKQSFTLSSTKPAIYLDPLKNLHLKPHYGSQVNAQIVKSLVVLAIIILIVTSVNFTNLYVSQASKRSKEVGIKKVNGVAKGQIIMQFLLEIFLQCLVALAFACAIVTLGLPYFNELLGVNLLITNISVNVIIQLIAALLLLTLLAGVYPAIIMAGFKPIEVLRGNQFVDKDALLWVRNGITALQFTFAIGFVITLIVIKQQVDYMKTQDTGFKARQVVYIENLGIYNHPDKFTPVSNRIKAITGVKNVSVASNVPGGYIPASYEYNIKNKAYSLQTIGVGYDYFETLNIRLKEGQFFSSTFKADSTNAVINETAAKVMGLTNPLGALVQGCGGNYKIIGVVKDVKANGFESNIQPAIYLMNAGCGLLKTQIMISADSKAIPAMLATLNQHWNDINKLDGDNFNYHFLDETYGKLFTKQEQLRSVLSYFSALAVFIAALGFFASAAQAIRLRMKEITIRKVLGASSSQLLVILSKPFFYIVIIANIIAWPASLLVSNRWLETFAYRIQISITPFAMALFISIAIVAITVCLQIARAIRFNPAARLKV